VHVHYLGQPFKGEVLGVTDRCKTRSVLRVTFCLMTSTMCQILTGFSALFPERASAAPSVDLARDKGGAFEKPLQTVVLTLRPVDLSGTATSFRARPS